MNETEARIRAHIDALLQDAPRTKAVDELREELYGGCLDKLHDLCAAGHSPEEAYNEVIAGIGDVEELVGLVTKAKSFDPELARDNRRKRALYLCAAITIFGVGLTIAGVMAAYYDLQLMGAMLALGSFCTAAIVCVYGIMTTPYKYEKQEDTIVEDLKTIMARGGKRQRLLGAASSSLWTMTTALYLIVSFTSWKWHLTWTMFLAATIVQILLKIYFSPPGERAGAFAGLYWVTVTLLYFVLSFWTMAWHGTWAIFVAAAAAQQIYRFISIWKE